MLENLEIYKTLTILCVEDEENVRLMYKEMFSLIFKEVYLAQDGVDGYECFEKEEIDIILTDQSMPRMTGLEMSNKIRQKDKTIPIIMVTALENLEILREAIDIHVTSFIKKPLATKSMFETLSFVAKSVVAERLLLKEQARQIEYSAYQENLTYQKETTIIKNDFIEEKCVGDFVCEYLFKPRDILSGDSYSLRKLSDEKSLYFIIDGMGKGISASVTAMMCCAYMNYLVDTKQTSSLTNMVENLVSFIGRNLLEDEVVSATFLLCEEGVMEYAMFSMPAMLYVEKGSDEVLKLRSNNPPLASYTTKINTTKIKTENIDKLLFFSDGLNENSLKDGSSFYGTKLSKDFYEVVNIKELEEKRLDSIGIQEDDVTYIFLKKRG
ncbi:Putative two-component response regulator [hydrothermal vent metagenome]|uniref:Putative two-component response regulator n=1 Tax=hydrothermal vent metagenome TaxID=652676 RepID=A0A1W1D390_9ZZZZ